KRTNHRRKIETDKRQRRSDEDAIHEANQQLPSKIGSDIAIDLRQELGDFVLQRRRPQGQILFPVRFNTRLFVQQEEQIDGHQDETEQKACYAEKAADTLLKDIPELFHQRRKRLLQIRHLFFHVRLDALAFGSGQLWRTWRDCFTSRRRLESFWRGRSGRLLVRRSRWRRPDEP